MLTYNFMFFFSLVLNFFFRRNVFWKFYQKILRCYAYMNQYMFLIKLILVVSAMCFLFLKLEMASRVTPRRCQIDEQIFITVWQTKWRPQS